VAIKPEETDHYTAAGAAMIGLTAWQALFEQAEVKAGQRVLVHGAAGGVGHVAVQLAAMAGAEVIGTASARNHDFVIGLGARDAIDYAAGPLEKGAKDIDVVIDTRAGQDFYRLLPTLAPDGIIVTLLGQDQDRDDAARAHGVRVAYTYVGPDEAVLAALAGLLSRGKLHIELERVLPLEQVTLAHAISEQGHVRGRLILNLA
jgi:NADPH:quinone reductase-like Zn-dependent oxidoreductase